MRSNGERVDAVRQRVARIKEQRRLRKNAWQYCLCRRPVWR